MKKSVKSMLAVAALAVAVVGCKTTTTTVYYDDPYYYPEAMYYDVYGYACGSLKPECTYLDDYSDRKAMWEDDWGYDYWANATWATVYDTDLGYYVEAYGFFGSTGVFYDYYTSRAINEGAEDMSRDVLERVAKSEEEVISAGAAKLASKFELSAETGLKVARALNDWNKIAKSRSRTEADLEAFSKRIYGVSLEEAKEALVAEDSAAQEKLLERAAETWNTTPEKMEKILSEMYAK